MQAPAVEFKGMQQRWCAGHKNLCKVTDFDGKLCCEPFLEHVRQCREVLKVGGC
jgi:hypothetical protein